jgi:hypothetical protein
MRARWGRTPAVFSLPGLELALKAVGGRALWAKVGTPFMASADKLLALGWKPQR